MRKYFHRKTKKMNEPLRWILTMTGGMVLGVFFFGGLWLTVKKSFVVKKPALLFAGSSILRTSITLAGLFYISHGNWRRVLIAMAGFIAARFLVMRFTKSFPEQPIRGERGIKFKTEVPNEIKS